MRSKNVLEDWLKLCDALLISITVQSILAMKLFKDFKLVFTQQKWLTNLILTESIRVKHNVN